MEDEKNTTPCSCEENGGIPHTHRNPPYSTEERTELMKKRREEHPAVKHNMQPFDDDELDSDEIEAEAKAFMEEIIKQRKTPKDLALLNAIEAKRK